MWYSVGEPSGYSWNCQPKSQPQNSFAFAVSPGRDLEMNHLACHVSPLVVVAAIQYDDEETPSVSTRLTASVPAMEPRGIEPLTFRMPSGRSPS